MLYDDGLFGSREGQCWYTYHKMLKMLITVHSMEVSVKMEIMHVDVLCRLLYMNREGC